MTPSPVLLPSLPLPAAFLAPSLLPCGCVVPGVLAPSALFLHRTFPAFPFLAPAFASPRSLLAAHCRSFLLSNLCSRVFLWAASLLLVCATQVPNPFRYAWPVATTSCSSSHPCTLSPWLALLLRSAGPVRSLSPPPLFCLSSLPLRLPTHPSPGSRRPNLSRQAPISRARATPFSRLDDVDVRHSAGSWGALSPRRCPAENPRLPDLGNEDHVDTQPPDRNVLTIRPAWLSNLFVDDFYVKSLFFINTYIQ